MHGYLCMPIYLYIDIHINEKDHLLNVKIVKHYSSKNLLFEVYKESTLDSSDPLCFTFT